MRREQEQLDANHALVAHRGREPGLKLNRNGRAGRVARMGAGADRFDARHLRAARRRRRAAAVHGCAGSASRPRSTTPQLTPSARTLEELRTTGESFAQFALRMSRVHKAYFLDLYPPNEQRLAEFAAEAARIAGAPAGRDRSGRRRDFRPVSGELLPNVESGTGEPRRRGDYSCSPGRNDDATA